MNKIKIKDKLIDLIFDKYCRMEEVAYHEDKLVCKDLEAMKKELKETLNMLLEQSSYVSTALNGISGTSFTNSDDTCSGFPKKCSTCVVKNFCIQKDRVECIGGINELK